MPRRKNALKTKIAKQEPVPASLSETVVVQLNKETLLVLQAYVDHGTTLPSVSLKTSYRDIWTRTKRFGPMRKRLGGVLERVQSAAKGAPETFSDTALLALPSDSALQTFLVEQSTFVHGLVGELAQVLGQWSEWEKGSEEDLGRLKEEVERLNSKAGAGAQERRDLLVELTRAVPVISCISDVLNRVLEGLKNVQQELDRLEESSEVCFGPLLPRWKKISSSGIHFL
ncbi:hypothetical protein FB45DRAFT_895887, partial [Roridomyces roridus]